MTKTTQSHPKFFSNKIDAARVTIPNREGGMRSMPYKKCDWRNSLRIESLRDLAQMQWHPLATGIDAVTEQTAIPTLGR